jgi:hypothetical protein
VALRAAYHSRRSGWALPTTTAGLEPAGPGLGLGFSPDETLVLAGFRVEGLGFSYNPKNPSRYNPKNPSRYNPKNPSHAWVHC